ncbi:class I adenylate-forming enzyme family protein [Pseudonocardia parietis]|uniref:Long-chain acyl-CoA synthetase n=1 Tax=Pseudonocardia parietis TaxID=570936 RepID=A0ABS4VT10_9PSEU|nr:class I adenylate-forming enzyme family protein [Pseudonocardia parietis]MBP2366926.1 long-chain acyl-CoA synthetase [Pseudonocardia parietis]
MQQSSALPVRGHDEVRAELTAPGAPFETIDLTATGVRAWRNAPPTLRAMIENASLFADRDFLVHDPELTGVAERLSYREVYRRVAGLARELAGTYGVRKGDRVAIAMRNLPEWPVAFFAAASVGAVVVPLNAWWEAPELEFGLRDSGARVLIVDRERLDRLHDVLPGLTVATLVARPDGPLPAGVRDLDEIAPADALPEASPDPDDPATIFYTSGTTGTPKGAFGTHRNICGNVTSLTYSAARAHLRGGGSLADLAAPAPPGVALVTVPLFHGTGCHSVLLGALHTGATLVLMHRWDPGAALELIERERVTTMTGVPAMLQQLLAHPDFDRRDTSSLTSVGSGGAPAPPALVSSVSRRLPGAAPANGYGLTETSSMTTANRGVDYLERPDSVGQAVAICDLRVVDPYTGEDLPVGQVGELWIRGANVVTGYWNRPDATAEAITDGWLHSGDLARIDADGFVYVVDRAKDMLIRGGENVYCSEVEAAVHEHPEVADCAVLGIPDEMLGEQVGVVVQLTPGGSLDEAGLREFLTGRIARFKIPVRLWAREEELPRNAAGKVLKPRLRAEYVQAGTPDGPPP